MVLAERIKLFEMNFHKYSFDLDYECVKIVPLKDCGLKMNK